MPASTALTTPTVPARRARDVLVAVACLIAGLLPIPYLLSASPAGAAVATYRVNSGGAAVTGSPSWTADTTASPSPLGNATASASATYATSKSVTLTSSVPTGTPAALFQSQRYDKPAGAQMIWTFPVSPGRYELRLYFAEIYSPAMAVGKRVFDVSSEGQLRLNDVDVFVEAGGGLKGIMKSFVVASDSSLDVSFAHVVENPAVQAIEVIPEPTSAGTLAATPTSVAFQDTTVGSTTSKPVTLTNTGGPGDPSITVSGVTVSGTHAAQFGEGFGASTVLAPGESTSLAATFTPTSTGTKSASLVVAHDGTAAPLTVPLGGAGTSASAVGFGKGALAGESSDAPTTLQFGPDGRLYVGQFDGLVKVYTVARSGPSAYTVTATQTIASIQGIANHNDSGSLDPTVDSRIVTGLLVTGTASSPVVYVTSSDPRIGGGGSGTDTGLDTNSSMVSKITLTSGTWTKTDLVRGLPRSEENHSANGLALDPATNTLYVAQGGNTNAGAPSNNFALLKEFALSAAILSIDLDAIGSSTYDLPTLDDSARAGTADAGDPFGGNNGANQARLVPGGPVQVHAPGFRNAYDVMFSSSGKMYTIDNGGNAGWGAPPAGEGPGGTCTNAVSEPGLSDPDALHLVTGPGYYGGHPNPTRASTSNTFSSPPQSPVSVGNAVECDYRKPGTTASTGLTTFPASTNGLAEYTASNFGGAMQGDLLAAGYSANALYRVQLNETGTAATSTGALISTIGANPLDVTTMGDTAAFPGTIWVADIGTGAINVFEPNDFGGGGGACTGADSTSLDEDGDGYDNADELDNGTSPCSSADVPSDADADLTSDLNDPDDDNDGSPDTSDPFAVDATDGLSTQVPISYSWDNGAPTPGGILNLGFTGLMTNGTADYRTLFDPDKMTAGGAAGVLTVDAVTPGDALGSANTQAYGLQFGVKPSQGVFTARTGVVAPFSGVTPSGQQSFGLAVGTGTQQDYVKVVVTAGGGSTAVQALKEVGGTVSSGQTSSLLLPGPDLVDLYLTVDPVAATVQPAYRVTSAGQAGPLIQVGTAFPVPPSWLVGTTQGLSVGLISTSAGATPFAATWDGMEVFSGAPAGNGATLRVNAGGPAVTVSPVWQADTAGAPSSYVNSAATTNKTYVTTAAVTAGSGVPTGTPTSLFQSHRFDPAGDPELAWAFPVAPGSYDVRLYFAELFPPNYAVGKRVFDVIIEGALVLNDLDVFREAGAGATGIMRSARVASDGTLNIGFAHGVENPMVSAIEIVPVSPAAGLVAEPASVTFPATPVGQNAASSVQLRHSGAAGSAAIQVTGVTLAGKSPGDFSAQLPAPVTLQPGGTTTVPLGFSPTTTGARAATLQVAHDGASSPLAVALSGSGTTPAAAQRVNAGGPAVSGSPVWQVDTAASPSPLVNAAATGNKTYATTRPVAAGPGVPTGTPPALLQTQRYDPAGGADLTWTFQVTPGAYDVRLYLAEIYQPNFAVGKRVFDVLVEGQLALDDVDPFKEAGAGDTAVMKKVGVSSDSALTVTFVRGVENPAVQAIEIVPRSSQAGVLSVTPQSLSFTSTQVGQSASASLVLRNEGAAGDPVITVSGGTVSGADAANFAYGPAGTVTVPPGATATRTVTFTPTTAGSRSASLTVHHDGQGASSVVPLSGTATAPPVGADGGVWTAEAPLPAPRAEVGVAAVGSKVYVVAGKTADGGLSTAMTVYDTVTRTWTAGPSLPGPARDHVGVVAVGGKVYALGGLTGYPGPAVSSVYAFDPAIGAWSTKASMPTGRGAMAVAVSGGKIWAAGGLAGGASVATVAAYDPVANTWAGKPAMPTARHHLSGEALDGTFYAIAGRTASLSGNVATVQALDTVTGTWSTRAPLPTARGGAGSAVLNGRIHVFGGDGNPANGSGGVYALHDEYNPATDTWRAVTALPTARHGTDGAVVAGKIYAPGGGSAQGLHDSGVNEVFALDLRGGWQSLPPLPDDRRESAVATIGEHLYVVGGNIGNEVRTNTVLRFTPATSTWSYVAPYPGAALDHFGWAVVGGKLFLVGGLQDVPAPGSTSVLAYEPTTDTWSTKASLPVDVGAAGAAAIGTKIYLAGGYTAGARTKTLRVYDTVTNSWATKTSMPTARDHVKLEAVDGRLYAIGGFIGGYPSGVTGKVEIYNPTINSWSTGAALPGARGDVGSAVVNGQVVLWGGINESGITGSTHQYDPVADAWRPLAPMAVPLRAANGAALSGRVFAFGGSDGVLDPSVRTAQVFAHR